MKTGPGRLVREDRLLRLPLDLGARRQEPGADRPRPLDRGRGRAVAVRPHGRRLPARRRPARWRSCSRARSSSRRSRRRSPSRSCARRSPNTRSRRRSSRSRTADAVLGRRNRRRQHEGSRSATARDAGGRRRLAAPRAPPCAPSAPKGQAGRRRRRTWPWRRRRPTSRPATSTSTTCSPRAGTRARSTSTACPRCATSRTIPVFTPYPATGYGFDDETKAMLGDLTWGDVHHPALSETNGDYDGRWLFVNEMNGRIARIDLRDFKTKQIFGPVPERLGQPRLVVRHAEHRVRDDGVALLDPDPEGHRRADRQVRHRLQGRRRRREDRPEDRRDVARAGRS